MGLSVTKRVVQFAINFVTDPDHLNSPMQRGWFDINSVFCQTS